MLIKFQGKGQGQGSAWVGKDQGLPASAACQGKGCLTVSTARRRHPLTGSPDRGCLTGLPRPTDRDGLEQPGRGTTWAGHPQGLPDRNTLLYHYYGEIKEKYLFSGLEKGVEIIISFLSFLIVNLL